MKRLASALALGALVACGPKAPSTNTDNATPPAPNGADAGAATATPPGDRQTQLDELLGPVFAKNRLVGLSIAIIEGGQTRTFHYGTLVAFGESQTADDTIYEIGSVSKVFTALLAADAAERGIIRLDDVVDDRLGAITFAHLASHVAGLPRLPGNIAPKNPLDPYVDYDDAAIEAWLKTATPMREPGRYLYSNLGAGLLGHKVAAAMKRTYAQAIDERIATPLGLADTSVVVAAAARERFATGHDEGGAEAAHWHFGALAGAGALRSTVTDMAAFVRANLDPTTVADERLRAAIIATHAPRHEVADGLRIGLGWHVTDGGWRWHNGQTGGFYSFVGFDPAGRRGLVVLGNRSTPLVEAVAGAIIALLDGKTPPAL